MFNNYTSLWTADETSQEYKNWKASGQKYDGINFMNSHDGINLINSHDGINFINFQRTQPLHLMLHTFLYNLGKMQHNTTIDPHPRLSPLAPHPYTVYSRKFLGLNGFIWMLSIRSPH